MEKETWHTIPGFDHIAISDQGRVVSLGYDIPKLRGGIRRVRSRLVAIRVTGTFGVTGKEGPKQFYLPTIYRQLFGRDLEGKPWPVNGRYLE